MQARLQLPSPAKLNLMLHITGRREDGYHLLQSVFQFIDLCDRLEFTVNSDGGIRRQGVNTPVAPADDILLTAARLLQARFEVDKGIDIGVDKRIPVGGGLGGGSSNAATCLLALNQLWELDLSLRQLAEIGLGLGADVPVFVHGRAAWATGIGEELQAIDLQESIYVVIDPASSVSTEQIFAAQELTRNCDPITIRAFLRGAGTNVCEPVVRKLYPRVGEAIDWLNQFGAARMSGTGACVFAEVDSLAQAETVKSLVPKPWAGYVARAMNRHPVHQQLGLLD
ncbi:MAG: 4-(cytidine 5'-diphospho)-2-C-methyl-D-erythritol kinase [Gammaproteobacteria bacterium]|nr:4-(cytidine 5'-diphospho)-2-C-methyl-D-erythritol kinase [Gammaproteobacteria bacterium]